MDVRIAKLESDVEYIKRDIGEIKGALRGFQSDQRVDFRTTWAGLITVALALAALMAKGFHWL